MGYVETATIMLDKERDFQVSFGTIRRFQKASGKTFQQLMTMVSELESNPGQADEGDVIELLGVLVWAGCSAGAPELTIDMVLDNLGMDPTVQLAPAFEAMGRALPSMEGQTPLAAKNGQAQSPGETLDGAQSGLSEESS